MAGPGEPQIVARAGTAEPAHMALPPGQAVGPLSVGRAGNWRVVAPGVLEEHAFLYFNGNELFLQSANPNSPVTVNGSPIPGSWTAVYAPCEIAFGGARLWFGTPEQQPRSLPPPAPPPPETSAIGKRPFTPRVQGLDDDESTRLHPIEEMQVSRRPAPRDPPSATLKSPMSPPSFGAPPPTFGAPPASAPAMGPGPQFGPPPPISFPGPGAAPDAPPGTMPPGAAPQGPNAPAAPAKPESWIAARWREASGPKKAMAVLMLPLIWAVWVIFTDKPPRPRPTKPATSAAAATSATPSASVPSAAPSVAPAPPPPEPALPPPSPSGKASASPSAAPSSTAKTPQREAADAVAVGAYDKAARLYEDLAKAHPDVPAYAEAARIMKAKAGKR